MIRSQNDKNSLWIFHTGMSFPIFGSREQNRIQTQYACRIEQTGQKYRLQTISFSLE